MHINYFFLPNKPYFFRFLKDFKNVVCQSYIGSISWSGDQHILIGWHTRNSLFKGGKPIDCLFHCISKSSFIFFCPMVNGNDIDLHKPIMRCLSSHQEVHVKSTTCLIKCCVFANINLSFAVSFTHFKFLKANYCDCQIRHHCPEHYLGFSELGRMLMHRREGIWSRVQKMYIL